MTTITNTETTTTTTMEDIQTWMTANSISITGSISLSIDDGGYVKSLITNATFTLPQITAFKQKFFNKRNQGNMGDSVSSASTITLTQGNLFEITGTTTINHITTTGWKKGSLICLDFASAITVNHNSSSPPTNTAALFLKGSTNASFNAGSTLTITYDGTYWREIGRMES